MSPARRIRRSVAALVLLALPAAANAQRTDAPAPATASRRVRLDADGVIRWSDTREEVRLFGANYALPSSSDYRAAGYLTQDRKRLIDEDMAHFARMGWDALRVAFWGDWQNADRQGNLIANDHLDLMDYLVARARERGIYILFNPIHTYHAGWPDALRDTFPGFAAHVPKDKLGTDPAAIAAQVNYLRQILAHVNRYTGLAVKDEPSILFVEMINEPVHHPGDIGGSVAYIDTLVGAVRAAGSRAITFHNVSQDFRIGEAIRRSSVQGASFGWYPTGLNAGRELQGNYLRTVDDYPALRMPELAGRPRLVYEFDTGDLQSASMYPAMVREFRAGGVQLAAMFAYDMLATASRNLGWQTHRLNLVYTPRKAMSAIIAAEAMRRLPRGVRYGAYPANRSFGPFRVSHEEDLSEMVTADAFLHAGSTRTVPPDPARLRRLAGVGSSPVVAYDGEGTWFLDRVRAGVWRLEVYPDAVDVEDPFGMQRRDKVVTRAIHRAHAMTVTLPDLGPSFTMQAVTGADIARAVGGRVTVRPGVYVLAARGAVDRATLPARIGALRFAEFHAPPPDSLPARVVATVLPQYAVGQPVEIRARVVAELPPDSVQLWVRRADRRWYAPLPMQRDGAYGYRASIPADSVREGSLDLMIGVRTGAVTMTFPAGVARDPWDWDFPAAARWRTSIVAPRVPLRLLSPADDAERLAFTRIGDGGRQGIYRIVPSTRSGESTLRLTLPAGFGADDPDDYTASLVVRERVLGRIADVARATGIRVVLRGVGPMQRVHLTLMEVDGTSWSASVDVDSTWTERVVPFAAFRAARGVKLPLGYPGTWNYWVEPAAGRGGAGDRLRPADVERLQLSLRREQGTAERGDAYGVEVESVVLLFD